MHQHTTPFTKSGFEKLKKELEELISKRPYAVKTLSRAREMGDLSENGLYKAAKFELGQLDRNITHLKRLIKSANVSIPTNNNIVQIGHVVEIRSEQQKLSYFLVGEFEADPKERKISNKSPIGYALMGKKTGDIVTINTPNKKLTYEIISISPAP